MPCQKKDVWDIKIFLPHKRKTMGKLKGISWMTHRCPIELAHLISSGRSGTMVCINWSMKALKAFDMTFDFNPFKSAF